MHQPYYKDPLTNEASMPWVRLHGIKDYLDMVEILGEYPAIKQTFNLVPSLLSQIDDYAKNTVEDKFLEISKKPARTLTDDDKIFILSNFFMANSRTMIEPYPRYLDLLIKRGRSTPITQIKSVLDRFNIQDFLDLQVWFNLSWFDPCFRESIKELKELTEKGKNFIEDDKSTVLKKQLDILHKIIPTYKKFQDNHQIEIITSAYYHPILPLLYDINSAKEALPSIKLPNIEINFKEDAKQQIHIAIAEYKKYFNKMPSGMWPSEGSVSNDAVSLFMEQGVQWIATDQEILYRSQLSSKTMPTIYAPYLIKKEEGELNIFFRDHVLSDLIGFVYYSWQTDVAVNDFVRRLNLIKDSIKDEGRPRIVNIILDGENAWEYYPDDGRPFLKMLYERLSNDSKLKTITPTEFLKNFPARESITHLFAGSWINANFSIWIGHPEKNTAWEYLAKTKMTLVDFLNKNPDFDKSIIEKAWQQIYIAEGSDWNWWYGEDHSSSFDEEFDRLYRKHLSNVYELIGLSKPDWLEIPIKTKKPILMSEPVSLIETVIDGKVTSYFEWLYAGKINVMQYGAMHQSENLVKTIYYGFNLCKFFVRIDLDLPRESNNNHFNIVIYCITSQIKIEILFLNNKTIEAHILNKDTNDVWHRVRPLGEIAFDAIVELAVTFEDLKITQEENIKIMFLVQKNGLVLESIPYTGPVTIKLPSSDFDAIYWSA